MSITKINNEVTVITTLSMENNTYILTNVNNEAIIIDPSFAGDDLIAYFEKNKAIKPIAIVLTHCHFDHCFDTAKVLAKYNVPVYIHKLDKITYEKFNCADWGWTQLTKFDKSIKYFDQSELQIGSFKLGVILTPGHTSGSITVIYNNYAFVGDTLFYNSYGRTDLANSSEQDMAKSLKTLFKVLKDDMYVFTGHGQWATFKEIKKVNFMAKVLAK